ncbi:hypothetical protein BOX15_Mlig004403g1, partial [Macrostomum lignano]
ANSIMASKTIEIPLKDTDEVIELDVDQLPSAEEVLTILRQETAALNVWVNLALEYYKKAEYAQFETILDAARTEASTDYADVEEDQMRCYDSLAAYYVQRAHREKNRDLKRELFTKATVLYTSADRINMMDVRHLFGRAFFFLYEGENVSQAEQQFKYVLNQVSDNVPAILGEACIAFNQRQYKEALGLYTKALQVCPTCPADVRLGLGHCYARLGRTDRAKAAFQRALALDPDCVGALVGVAITELNEKSPESIRKGVEHLSRAYRIDPTNSMVLNHLANHFFYKKEYAKVQSLALHAFHNTDNEAMRAESCFQLARAYHVQGDFDQAFQYYYQSTQFASPTFILPFFGLGQMYLYRRDQDNAALAFEKVLKASPSNYETLKILGSIYSQSKDQAKRTLARNYLKQVTDQFPDDVEAWIEYGQILEQPQPQEALAAYKTAVKLLQEQVQVDLPPEILNNMASLLFQNGSHQEAIQCYQQALAYCERERQTDERYYGSITVTVRYNLARLYETVFEHDKAELLYKSVLREHTNYADCYLRLGCMARDRGQIYSASDWFKDALNVDQEHPDAWTLIGMLHMSKHEYGPAQKKFERIIQQPAHTNDAYAHVALGNIWLQTLHHQMARDKDKERRHQERALSMYKSVLRQDPRNIWAAHGIGCVLAHKGYINEARDVFAQVREATADFADVWINIAHIHVEQKSFVAAVQMYENCMKKFHRHNNLELLQYLARAYFKSGQLRQCRTVLLRARHAHPADHTVIYNLALVQQRLASVTLQDEKSSYAQVQTAVEDLKLAQRSFRWLAEAAASGTSSGGVSFPGAGRESVACADLLRQADYHVRRARLLDERERAAREEQAAKVAAMREQEMREAEERRQREAEREQAIREARRLVLERNRKLLEEPLVHMAEPPSSSGKGGRRSAAAADLSGDEEGGGKRKRRRGGGGESKQRRRQQAASANAADDEDGLTKRQRENVKSRAFVSSSSGSSSSSSSSGEEDGQEGGDGGGKSKKSSPPAAPPRTVPTLDSSGSSSSDLSDDDDGSSGGAASRKRKRRQSKVTTESSAKRQRQQKSSKAKAKARVKQQKRNKRKSKMSSEAARTAASIFGGGGGGGGDSSSGGSSSGDDSGAGRGGRGRGSDSDSDTGVASRVQRSKLLSSGSESDEEASVAPATDADSAAVTAAGAANVSPTKRRAAVLSSDDDDDEDAEVAVPKISSGSDSD